MRILRSLVLGLGAIFVLVAAPTAFVAANANGPNSDLSASAANPQTEGFDAKALESLASTEQITDCKRQSAANPSGQDIFLSTGTPRTYLNAGGAWQNVECASTTFRLTTGQRAIIVSNFNAEADCNGTAGQWCQTRALLQQVAPVVGLAMEGSPVAAEPSSFAFDSTAGGSNNWQAHSMGRAWEIRCANTNGCQYKFVVQTRMHSSAVSGMWLDEIAAHLRVTYGNPAPL
ncbi:MAG TPA: hypothetical protein VFB59_04490 [Candidatus Saccharimonadales bacterium]|nr:hypothetical protein [Candidatus Saccharimonadales bacterium]